MEINNIVESQVNLLSSYIDQLRSHFNITHKHNVSIPSIHLDNDIYTVIYEIRPSQYLYSNIGQSLDQFKQILINLFNTGIIDINIDNEKIEIKVKFGLEHISVVPAEIMFNILIDLPYEDIKNYCLTSYEANQICLSDSFWGKKLRKEYPELNIKYEEGKIEGYYKIQQFINKYNDKNMNIREILNLQYLILSNNKIKEIPDSIGLLTNLFELDLRNNEIKKIHNSISLLTNLIKLTLDNNKIEKIPDSIGNLTNLIRFTLNNNKIKEIPDSIGNLTNLQHLYLGNNEIKEIPYSIGLLTNLHTLDLSDTQIKKLPNSISKLINLKIFMLYDTEITKLPDSLGLLANLQLIIHKNVYISPILESILRGNNVIINKM